MLEIKIHTDNAAFDDNVPGEVARILRALADKIEAGIGSDLERGTLLDVNGNPTGTYDWCI
jgi:hypothetical protein